MDNVSQNYQQEAQNQINQIQYQYQEFRNACDEQKRLTEQEIALLSPNDPDKVNKENLLKLQLKKKLDKLLAQLEKKLHTNFTLGIVKLEDIYHQKEVKKLLEIEETLTRMQ